MESLSQKSTLIVGSCARRDCDREYSCWAVMQFHIHHWKALTLRIPEWYVFKWVTPEKLEKLAFFSNPLISFALSHAHFSHLVCFWVCIGQNFFKLKKAVTFLLLYLKLFEKYILTCKNRNFYSKSYFWLINLVILMVGSL